MNKRELIQAVAGHTGVDAKTTAKVVDGLTEVITATIAKDEPVRLSGFANFAKVKRAARMGRNPQTGEPVKIKASTKARITPLKGLKDVVAGTVKPPKINKAAAAPAKKAAAPAKKAAPPAKKAAAPAKKAAAAKK